MLDRRTLLMTGATALAGCASSPEATTPDPQADSAFRELVVRLADRQRSSRPFLLRRVDAARLSPDTRALYESLLPAADAEAALAAFTYGDAAFPYAVTQRNGNYRTSTPDARTINRETARLEGDAARGIIAPDFVLDATIQAVEDAARHASDDVAAAFARQIEALRALRASASHDAGVWRLPDGEDYFAQLLKLNLGAAADPREAHERARVRCDALQTQADVTLRQIGMTNGDVVARLRALVNDPRHLTGRTDASKDQAVALMRASLERAPTLFANLFAQPLPEAQVQRLPAAQEANGAQGRRQGNAYLVDLGAPRPRWSLPSVVYHELIPGHILQAPYERAAAPPSLQLRYANGYSEGWATYAETLADEAGAFDADPLTQIGYLQWMLFRNARIVADIGMHVLRWSREQAIAEMRALQGDSIAFISIEDDVARMAAQPAFAAAQGLAALHIHDLRESTRRRAGAHFSLRTFHDAMLRHGPLSPPGLDDAARAAFGLA